MKSLELRAGANTFWLFLSDLLLRGSIFLGTLYLARVLGTKEFGIFSFALVLANYLWLMVDLGIANYGTREAASRQSNVEEILDELNSLRFFLSLFIYSAFFLVFTIFLNSANKLTYIAAGFYIVAFALNPDWFIRGIEKMKYLVVGNFITGIFFLSGTFLFITGPEDTALALLFWSVSFLVSGLSTLIIIWKYLDYRFVLVVDIEKWKHHLKNSIHFALSGSLIRINSFLSIFILGFLVLPEDLGIFSAPHRLILTVVNLNFIIPKAFYPILSSQRDDPVQFRHSNEKFYSVLMLTGIPVGLFGYFFAADLIGLLFGRSYLQSTSIFKILIWQVPIIFLSIGIINSLFAIGLQRINTYVIGAGVLIKLILCLILIPKYGINGAAFSDLIGAAFVLIFLVVLFSLNVYRSSFLNLDIIKIVLSCIIVIAFVYLVLSGFGFIIKIVLSAVLYLVLVFILGVLKKEMVYRVFRNLRNIKDNSS